MVTDHEHLADPRLISTTDLEDTLGGRIADALLAARDDTIERLRLEYGDAPIAGVSNFDSIARNSINVALSEADIQRVARVSMEDSIERTLDRFDSQVHSPKIDVPFGSRHQQSARFISRSTELDVRNAAEDMLDRTRTQVRNAAMAGESMDQIERRIRDQFSDSKVEARANLIAQMNLQSATQTVKLEEYTRHDDILGVSLANPCNSSTTPLCENLAGCGSRDAVVAWFGDNKTIGEQFSDSVSEGLMFEGFQPLFIPPFHWSCRTELIPVSNK